MGSKQIFKSLRWKINEFELGIVGPIELADFLKDAIEAMEGIPFDKVQEALAFLPEIKISKQIKDFDKGPLVLKLIAWLNVLPDSLIKPNSPEKYRCPCCKKWKTVKEVRILENFHRSNINNRILSVFHAAHGLGLKWACDKCINTTKALLADPSKQETGAYSHPFYAYIDEEKICEDCHNPFLFSKEEQKYWYEELGFIIFAYPKQCKECRKKIRERNFRNTLLEKFLKDISPQNIEGIIDIYLEIGNVEKVKFYITYARKQFKLLINKEKELKALIKS